MIGVSKTFGGGSIPSSPAQQVVETLRIKVFGYFFIEYLEKAAENSKNGRRSTKENLVHQIGARDFCILLKWFLLFKICFRSKLNAQLFELFHIYC